MNVLLSIKPKYVQTIINGKKKYEFRKKVFKRHDKIKNVYIYSTSPEKKIVAYFTIKDIIEGHPKKLWKRFEKYSGLDEKEFNLYFLDSKTGFAIEIGELTVFEKPLNPNDFISNFKAPQSFMYLDDDKLNKLKLS